MTSLLSRQQHSKLLQLRGAPEVELLAAESCQLLNAISPTLVRMLRLAPGPETVSLLDSVPVLTLRLNDYVPRVLTDADRPAILNAFAVLIRYSQRLDALPDIKTAFWFDVFQSVMMWEDTLSVHEVLFKTPAFPKFAIEVSIQYATNWSTVNEALGDALYAFMTTSPTPPAQLPASSALQTDPAPPVVALSLSFAKCELTPASLEIIERFLDRVFAADPASLQFAVKSLDFSNNKMRSADLAVLARIVPKAMSVYHVEELKLDGIMPNYSSADCRPTNETPTEYLDIVRSVFAIDDAPLLSASEFPQRIRSGNAQSSSQLRKISLSNNVVCPKLFVTLFTALRYGCPLEEDLTRYDVWFHGQTDCWRWLAFALFYPRPKRFANAFKLRSIGELQNVHLFIQTIANTLRNPVLELVFDGVEGPDSAAPACLMVCTVEKGACIEIFKSGLRDEWPLARPTRTWHDTLLERREFEALCERSDGTVCVVVPGVGLGWVDPEDIECIEREPLEPSRSEQDGMFDAAFNLRGQAFYGNDHQLLFAAIGRQLGSLTFCFERSCENIPAGLVQNNLMQSIRDHCVNLQHLNLRFACAADISALLDALNGDLGQRLLTLNLNSCGAGFRHEEGSIAQLTTMLGDPTILPVLREVRLHQCGLGAQSLANLHDALQVNRTLAQIELEGTSAGYVSDSDFIAVRERLEGDYQGQLLHASTPMETKLALLSVAASGTTQPGKEATALRSLDQYLLSLVFELEASIHVRRTIAWSQQIRRHGSLFG